MIKREISPSATVFVGWISPLIMMNLRDGTSDRGVDSSTTYRTAETTLTRFSPPPVGLTIAVMVMEKWLASVFELTC